MAADAAVLATATPPGLQEATKNSTAVWQQQLQELFKRAKDRFPDVVWELTRDGDESRHVDEVWGHKAIVYARAPPSFQNRYFSFRSQPVVPYSSSPTETLPATSALSLGLDTHADVSRTPSPFPSSSPVPSTPGPGNGALLRLSTSINPSLFSNELEYLYTGQGFGEAFEFLFDSSDSHDYHPGEHDDPEALRIDKLRKDLVFMWRSRLYSDVRIALTGNFSATHENTTAIFSSHRFLLISRSPYFYSSLMSWPSSKTAQADEQPLLTLPSPPFTPASLHFTLGFMYTGTLVFSHRTFDLSTAFAILKAALYLSLPTLHDEIQARIAHEMMHGLFHAFLSFPEYENVTGGRWGTGGCRCRQCSRRAPRVLEFAIMEDVKNPHLERGARRALVGMFGEGWCTQEFASMPQKLREALLRGVGKRTTPVNVFSLLFAAEHALEKLSNVMEPWSDTIRDMIFSARKGMDELLTKEAEACFTGDDWNKLMESDGVRFEDGEQVEWVMAAILRGVREPWAATLYQTLVSTILLRPHPTDVSAPLLSSTSHIRVQVEETRLELLRWISKRWIGIRQAKGFDQLESWALKEISDHIEVPVDDLINLPSLSSPARRNKSKSTTASLLRPAPAHPRTSRISMKSERKENGDHEIAKSSRADEDDATEKDTDDGQSLVSGISQRSALSKKTLITRASVQHAASRASGVTGKTSPSSSIRSHASTVRKSSGSNATSFRSFPSDHRNSGALTNSQTVTKKKEQPPVRATDPGRLSLRPASSRTAAARSNASTPEVPLKKSTVIKKSPSIATKERQTQLNRETADKSSKQTINLKRNTKATVTEDKKSSPSETQLSKVGQTEKNQALSDSSSISLMAEHKKSSSAASMASIVTLKRRTSADTVKTNTVFSTTSSSAGISKLQNTPKTCPPNNLPPDPEFQKQDFKKNLDATGAKSRVPRGATLEIGIPCIISSKRKRFKAYARYIGEVEGEIGPWVGVEVPVTTGESWGVSDGDDSNALSGPQWNDGTWRGVRYFDIGLGGADCDYDDRAARRRRVDVGNVGRISEKGILKREGEQLHMSSERMKRIRNKSPAISESSMSESRGLFIRPQQVLYVVDAVGSV